MAQARGVWYMLARIPSADGAARAPREACVWPLELENTHWWAVPTRVGAMAAGPPAHKLKLFGRGSSACNVWPAALLPPRSAQRENCTTRPRRRCRVCSVSRCRPQSMPRLWFGSVFACCWLAGEQPTKLTLPAACTLLGAAAPPARAAPRCAQSAPRLCAARAAYAACCLLLLPVGEPTTGSAYAYRLPGVCITGLFLLCFVGFGNAGGWTRSTQGKDRTESV